MDDPTERIAILVDRVSTLEGELAASERYVVTLEDGEKLLSNLTDALRAQLEAANEHNVSLRSQVEAYIEKSHTQSAQLEAERGSTRHLRHACEVTLIVLRSPTLSKPTIDNTIALLAAAAEAAPVEADTDVWDRVEEIAPQEIADSMRREIHCEHMMQIDDCPTCSKAEE